MKSIQLKIKKLIQVYPSYISVEVKKLVFGLVAIVKVTKDGVLYGFKNHIILQ